MKPKISVLTLVAMMGMGLVSSRAQDGAKSLHLRPLPMKEWLEKKEITVVAPAYDSGSPKDIFDGNTETLMRSMEINPQTTYVEFDGAQSLRAVRVVISHHVGRWKLEGRLEDETALRELIAWTPAGDGETSEVVLPVTLPVTALRLTVQRIGGDNHVHLNEWELLQEVVSENNTP